MPMPIPTRRDTLGLSALTVLGATGSAAGLAGCASADLPSARQSGPRPGTGVDRRPDTRTDTRTGGRLDTVAAFASSHVAPRRVTVWLPRGYDGSTPHAVLYMHDGQNLFDPANAYGGHSWDVGLRLAALIAQRAVQPTLVVGLWNTPLRWREYVPAPAVRGLPPDLQRVLVAPDATGQPAPASAREALSDAYLRCIVEEVKPWVDARYATRPQREHTFVMGSSMGGLISLQALLRYPEVFAGAGCVSTHWPVSTHYALLNAVDPGSRQQVSGIGQHWLDAVAQRLPAPGRHRLYFDHGTLGLDRLYAPFQQRMDALLSQRGWQPGSDSHSQVFPGTDHNEASWSARVSIPLRFLLAPRAA